MDDETNYIEYCDVTQKQYDSCAVRRCPHPAVIKKHGFKGVCNVSVWVCKKCRYSQRDEHMDAYGCTYGK